MVRAEIERASNVLVRAKKNVHRVTLIALQPLNATSDAHTSRAHCRLVYEIKLAVRILRPIVYATTEKKPIQFNQIYLFFCFEIQKILFENWRIF